MPSTSSNYQIPSSPTYSRASTASPTDTALRTPTISPRSVPILLPTLDLPYPSSSRSLKSGGSMPVSQPASPTGTIRRPTTRRTTDLRSEGSGGAGPSNSSSSSGYGKEASAASRRVSDDDGLIMRERGERDEGSVGRAKGVDVHGGATRPKRRLSSLPSLPHPYHSSTPDYRALSTSSPPSSPGRYGQTTNPTYQVLANGIGNPNSNSYAYTNGLHSAQRMHEKMNEKSSMMSVREGKEGGSPRLFGIELKWISLLTLALQNAFLTIIMHYSRITASPSKTYSAASAVLLNELLKGSISIIIALRNIDKSMTASSAHSPYSEKDPNSHSRSSPLLVTRQSILASRFSLFHPTRLRALRQALFSRDCIQLSIPAILYVIQNNLQYTAASNLDVATFQVTYQMKILTTAAFSVIMLRRKLSKTKWLALFLLAIGVGIVQIQSTSAPSVSPPPQHSTRSDIPEIVATAIHTMSPLKGFLAVTAACMTSGLAGVYFELLLKPSSSATSSTTPTPQPDLWIRNTQLSLFSLIPAILPILFNGSSDGLGPIGRLMAAFANFNGWAIGTVLTQTFGGLITAIVIRYSDNIMKGFATSLSIIISFLASVALFSYPITFAFVLGSSVVLAATCLYNLPTPPTPVTRKEMANPPGSPISTSAPILGEPTPEKPSRASSVISLLGLGSSRAGSRAPSRAPSGDNLRGMAFVGGGMSNLNPSSNVGYSYGVGGGGNNNNHIYAASAPGTPYFSPSGINTLSNPYEVSTGIIPPRRGSPLPPLEIDGRVQNRPLCGPGSGFGLMVRKGSQSGESNSSSH